MSPGATRTKACRRCGQTRPKTRPRASMESTGFTNTCRRCASKTRSISIARTAPTIRHVAEGRRNRLSRSEEAGWSSETPQVLRDSGRRTKQQRQKRQGQERGRERNGGRQRSGTTTAHHSRRLHITKKSTSTIGRREMSCSNGPHSDAS